MENVKIVIGSLIVLFVAWASGWAWSVSERLAKLEADSALLITPDGEIRPSIKVEVLEERIENLKKCYEDSE